MKSQGAIIVLLAASVALVAGIVGVARTGRPPMSGEQEQTARTLVHTNVNVRIAREEISSAAAEPEAKPKFKWSEIESADYRLYVAHLRIDRLSRSDIARHHHRGREQIVCAARGTAEAEDREFFFEFVHRAERWMRGRKRRTMSAGKSCAKCNWRSAALIKELLGIEIEIEPLRTSNSRKYEMFDAAFNALPVEKREAVRALQEKLLDRVGCAWMPSTERPARITGQTRRSAKNTKRSTTIDARTDETSHAGSDRDFDMRTTNTGNALRKAPGEL
jgi:hypothetical protein